MDDESRSLLSLCQSKVSERGKNLFEYRTFFGQPFNTRSANQIRVMHWNILANVLSGSKTNDHKTFDSPKECLPWDFRRWRVLEEIAYYNPDIMTLVELDEGEDLMKNLKSLGYEMDFIKKLGDKKDGTGIFYKSSRFEVIERDSGPYYAKNPEKPSGIYTQVFHCLTLKPKDGGEPFAVCGLHLKSSKNQEGEEIRAVQVRECVQRLKKARDVFGCPVIICGDFNGSRVPVEIKGAEIKPIALNVAIQAGFQSCYEQVMGKDPLFTSWKTRSGYTFKYAVDYMLSTEDVLPKAVLGMVPEERVPEYHFPNFQSPSDHISLICDLEIGPVAPGWRRTKVFLILILVVVATIIGIVIWQFS